MNNYKQFSKTDTYSGVITYIRDYGGQKSKITQEKEYVFKNMFFSEFYNLCNIQYNNHKRTKDHNPNTKKINSWIVDLLIKNDQTGETLHIKEESDINYFLNIPIEYLYAENKNMNKEQRIVESFESFHKLNEANYDIESMTDFKLYVNRIKEGLNSDLIPEKLKTSYKKILENCEVVLKMDQDIKNGSLRSIVNKAYKNFILGTDRTRLTILQVPDMEDIEKNIYTIKLRTGIIKLKWRGESRYMRDKFTITIKDGKIDSVMSKF